MASGLLIQSGGQAGGSTTNVANVDANGNITVNTPTTPAQAGYSVNSAVVTDGVAYPTNAPRQVRRIEATEAFRQKSSGSSPMLSAFFPGAAIDTGVWSQSLATMTLAVTGGFCNLNSGNSVATTVDAIIKSYKFFPIYEDAETTFRCKLAFPQVAQANTVMEWGLFIAATTAAPTDGVLFRINGSGNFIAVMNNAGTEQVQDLGVAMSASTTYRFKIKVTQYAAYYYINEELAATLVLQASSPTSTEALYAPACFRIYNTGSAPSLANQIKIASCHVTLCDYGNTRDWRSAQVGQGSMAIQGQVGATLGTLQNYANGAAPSATALSATTAEYATLGGQYVFATTASAETDFIVFAYLVPAGTAALPGKSLFITGVRISAINVGAAVATTATVLQWALGVGSTAITLATADGAGTKATRRLGLGMMYWPIGAAIGAGPQQPDIDHELTTPLVANQGEYVHVIVKMPIGTATTSQQIRGLVTIEGYWE